MDVQTLLGCPYCQGPLAATGDPQNAWQCSACGRRFGQEGRSRCCSGRSVSRILPRFAHQYREARRREGWQPPTPEEALALPYRQPAG